jgi:hypothetical protein
MLREDNHGIICLYKSHSLVLFFLGANEREFIATKETGPHQRESHSLVPRLRSVQYPSVRKFIVPTTDSSVKSMEGTLAV